MALILSATTGNFNAGATWVGGIVPGAADEARASTGHTVTITANVTCTEISNAGTGNFILNSGVTLTANCTNKSATASVTLITFSGASPATANIVGNCTGGTVNVALAANNSSTGALTITGNVTAGSGISAYAAYNGSTGSIVIIGNALGGGAANSVAAYNQASGTITMTGNVTGGTNTTAHGLLNAGAGTISITGNVTATTATSVSNSSTGPVTITGNITASTAAGVTNSSTATLTISGGTYTASTVANAVISTNASSVVRASGSFIHASNGFVPINAVKFILLTTPTLAKTRYALNGSTTYVDMFTADNSLGQAAITDVRFGTVYASGALTGVAYIPATASVAFGVPVDNTTGTAALTPASVWDHLLSAITASSTIGTLLKTNIDATISSRSTLTAANVRTELTPELTEIGEIHAIHGLDIANALTVTPTLRSAGAITQAITGDGTTSTIVTRV